MRTLDSARESWQELRQYRSIGELKQNVRLDGGSSIATAGGRSACWKTFLMFETLDSSAWLKTLSSSRSAYNSLKSHFLRHIENPDALAANYDPLSETADTSNASPWTQLRKDEELRAEIKQDVDRCMQEYEYFRLEETQRIMLDILFVYCRLNPDVSYRQGMHEILAPILWVVEADAIDLGQSSKAMGEDAIIKDLFDAACIEHDAFALFGQIMQSAKNFYEQTTHQGAENPIVSRSRRIFTDMLPLVDNELAQHLERVDIVPQVFLIRWVRLIFGREFAFEDLLTIWDVIFAEDPTLEIVDHICLTMLLRMRWKLVEADYNSALTLLLKYPVEDENKDFVPQSLALDALYLREHLDYHGGSYLVSKYTGKSLLHNERPATPPALQRNITTFTVPTGKGSASTSRLSPNRTPRPPRAFESVLRSTAKNIYARGEELGIGKAVKGAVDEVHRRAQEIRDIQTPSPPVNARSRVPRGSIGSASAAAQVQVLEGRNKQLAKLLEGAVKELWDCQKDVATGHDAEESQARSDSRTANLEKLSIAIAKVQFVQVYLEDSSLPLPDEDENDVAQSRPGDAGQAGAAAAATSHGPAATVPHAKGDDYFDAIAPRESVDAKSAGSTAVSDGPNATGDLADPSTFDDIDEQKAEQRSNVPQVVVHSDAPKSQPNSPPQDTQPSRTSLEQSSFSWMLDKDESPAKRPSSVVTPFPKDQRARSFLFGGADGDERSRTGSQEKRGSGKQIKQPVEARLDDEGFDMSSLRHGKRK